MSHFSEEKSIEFLDAAEKGNLQLVQSLSLDPEVDVDRLDPDYCFTPFFCASVGGHVDVIRFLLDFHDSQRDPIDYNLPNHFGNTPFSAACVCGNEDVVEMLLEDDRIDVTRANGIEETPLWQASYHGHPGVVKRMLASTREIDFPKQDRAGKALAEVARKRGERAQKYPHESDTEFQQRKEGFIEVASLVESYQLDPEGVKVQLRKELGMGERLAGELFALVVYMSDGYLALRSEKQGQTEQHRFLSIAAELPLDLQMVLCNRVFGVPHPIIRKIHSEQGFRKFVKRF